MSNGNDDDIPDLLDEGGDVEAIFPQHAVPKIPSNEEIIAVVKLVKKAVDGVDIAKEIAAKVTENEGIPEKERNHIMMAVAGVDRFSGEVSPECQMFMTAMLAHILMMTDKKARICDKVASFGRELEHGKHVIKSPDVDRAEALRGMIQGMLDEARK